MVTIAFFGLGAVIIGWLFLLPQPVQVNLPNARWEPIFFKPINTATKLAELTELRKAALSNGDIEVRVWRGFGLSPFEGVVLKRVSGQWSAVHIKTDDYYEPTAVSVRKLRRPKSGWNQFWQSVTDKGLLTMRDPSEFNCVNTDFLDGTSYVVEINQNYSYRTYGNASRGCPGIAQMDDVGEIIGLEFDSGEEECKTDEWFPCMTFNKSKNM